MASVSYHNVTKRFSAETVAVANLNLEVRDGECLVLVGPSGCGKSTSLRMLAGLEEITEGEILIGDRVVNRVPPSDRDIAMVFQNYALYPHMSVYDNMSFGLRMRGFRKDHIERKVREAADMLGLERLLDRKPRALSGGQRQRVALGRAIVREPQVFLLDEPLSNLDSALRAETRIHLQRLHRDLQTTFFYVTHDQVEAMTMGDRIAVMREGTLQQISSPRELYDHPVNMYVARFIGSPRMNMIPVTARDRAVTGPGLSFLLESAIPLENGFLGVRPEDMSMSPKSDAVKITATVDLVEILGADQYVYGDLGGTDIIARVPPDVSIAPGSQLPLQINLDRAHLFDGASELSVPFQLAQSQLV